MAAQQDSPAEEAMALARKAARAAKIGQAAQAYLLYSQAAALRPNDKKYKTLMDALKASAEKQATKPAIGADDEPEVEVFDSMTAREAAAGRQLQGPPALDAKPGLQDFDLNGETRSLFDRVAQRFGLEAVYDADFPSPGRQLHFQITGVDYRDALHDLEAATGAFVVPLSRKLFLVANDTAQKRTELEQTISVSIQVPQAVTTQELTEIAQAVRQTTNIEKIGWNSARSEITLRDRVSRVTQAQALLQQLLAYRSEVMIEVEFLELTESDIRNYGFNVTNSFQAFYLGRVLNNAISIPSTLTNLVTFGGGRTLIGLGVAQAQALFNQTTSSAHTLFRAQMRAVEGQPATFHAGQKFPIITSQYTGSTSASTTGTAIAPAFTFEDLGVQVKVTPHVHDMGEMTLAVETSYELLTGSAVNGLPIIGRRQLNTSIRLREGEWAIVAGLMNPSDSKAVSGFWGMAQIPLVGNLFKQVSTDKEESSVLVVIKPHLLSLPPDQVVTRALRMGTETRPYNPL